MKISKTAVPAVTVRKPARKAAAPVLIDFPQEGEMVRPPHYTIRLSTPKPAPVEVSINGGPWQPARESCGFQWVDWTPSAGDAKIVARVKLGKLFRKAERACRVASEA